MKNIRVLHIMDKVSVDGSNIQGPARQLSYRAPFYKNNHVETLLCNLREEASACDILRKNNVEVISLGRGKFDIFAIRDLQKLVDTWEPDILHLSGYAAWTFGRILRLKKEVAILLQEHFIDRKMPLYQKFLDWILKRRSCKGLAVSNSVRDFMYHERYIPLEKIRVIGNGIPSNQIKIPSDQEIEDLRNRYNIKPDSLVIGNLARLATMKGQRYFVEAAAIIKKVQNNINFVVVGEGPLEADLKQLAIELGVFDNFVFAGYQEDVYPFLKLFDVTVIASIFGEGFCSVGLESFSVSTPVVITEHALVDNVYKDKENCLVVPTGNAQEIARAILEILHNRHISERLIQGGHRVIQECNSEAVANNYCNYYKELSNAYGE
jgi:glycosyltransferase involved in cell wall biosynthesis